MPRNFTFLCILFSICKCYSYTPQHLLERNATVWFSYSAESQQQGYTADVLINCTDNRPVDLYKATFNYTIRTLKISECVLEKISRVTAMQLIGQGVRRIETRYAVLRFERRAYEAFGYSLDSLIVQNSALTGEIRLEYLNNLKTLEISYSNLDTIPGGLELLSSPGSINLSGNKLKKFNLELGTNWSSLQTLMLSGNKFKDSLNLTSLLIAAPNLMTLDLSRNLLTSLTCSNIQTSRLQHLFLSNNPIISLNFILDLDWMFQQNLDILDLSRNKISSVAPQQMKVLSQLHYLDLSFNELDRLDITLDKVPLPTLMNLEGNPFVCDCHMLWIGGSERFQSQPLPRCTSPPRTTQYKLHNYPPTTCTELYGVLTSDFTEKVYKTLQRKISPPITAESWNTSWNALFSLVTVALFITAVIMMICSVAKRRL